MIRTMLSKLRPITALLVALSLIGFATAASAEDDEGLTEWDENENGVLEEEEFNAGLDEENDYETWDENDDGVVNEDEYNAGLFDTFDENDDGIIDDDEYGDDLL